MWTKLILLSVLAIGILPDQAQSQGNSSIKSRIIITRLNIKSFARAIEILFSKIRIEYYDVTHYEIGFVIVISM